MKLFCDGSLQLFAESDSQSGGANRAAENTAAGAAENTDAGAAENTVKTASAETERAAEKQPGTGGKDARRGGENGGGSFTGGDTDNILNGVRESFGESLKNAEAESVLASWRREEQATREIYPSFSMKNELLNEPMFGTLLKSGVGVRRAYECVHLEEIIGSAIRYAVADIGRKTALNSSRTQSRPGENSVLDRAASVARTDVNSLTDRDIKRILAEVSRGAKISFK
ncbi:MAG: hypothetical protein SOX69_09040 [Oscillospiraceae bacterium]|nr:hypothetical protein [Oscillospiraceae bacterium]